MDVSELENQLSDRLRNRPLQWHRQPWSFGSSLFNVREKWLRILLPLRIPKFRIEEAVDNIRHRLRSGMQAGRPCKTLHAIAKEIGVQMGMGTALRPDEALTASMLDLALSTELQVSLAVTAVITALEHHSVRVLTARGETLDAWGIVFKVVAYLYVPDTQKVEFFGKAYEFMEMRKNERQ